MILFIICSAIVFLLSLIVPKSKYVSVAQLILIWIIMGFNCGGMDYDGNLNIFNLSGRKSEVTFGSGWLSDILCRFAHINNWDYVTYNAILCGILLATMAIVVFIETDKPCVFYNLFCLYPLMESVIQKRFFCGMIMIVLGIFFLKRDKMLLYVIFAILATGFHFSFIAYLPLIFIKYLNDKKIWKYMIVAYLLLFLTLKYGGNYLGKFLNSSKLNLYIYDASYSSTFTGIIFALAMLIQIMLLNFALDIYESNMNKDYNFLKKLNMCMLVLVPMCLFESVYFRYYRVVVLYTYLLISKSSDIKSNSNKLIVNKSFLYMMGSVAFTIILEYLIYINTPFGLKGYIETLFYNRLLIS